MRIMFISIDLLTQNLSELEKKKVPTSKINIDSGVSNGPELKFEDIDSDAQLSIS